MALAALLAAGPPALAQQRPAAPPAPAQPAPPPEPPPPPYERQMLRLSEILGALAFLRELCGAGDGEAWRAKMTALLEAEATTEARKARLAGAYNRGYRGFQLAHRGCSATVETAIARYLAEGTRIAREISGRWSGG
jgi:uncharacterized protein (TIGR02301 family)